MGRARAAWSIPPLLGTAPEHYAGTRQYTETRGAPASVREVALIVRFAFNHPIENSDIGADYAGIRQDFRRKFRWRRWRAANPADDPFNDSFQLTIVVEIDELGRSEQKRYIGVVESNRNDTLIEGKSDVSFPLHPHGRERTARIEQHDTSRLT